MGLGRGDPHRNMLLPHLSYHANVGYSGPDCTSVINGDLSKKIDPSRPTFQSHSRFLEPTQVYRQPTTCY